MGNDVIVKLTKQETNGEYYLFEIVTPPGVGGWINYHLALKDRGWRCASCQEIVDRDANAALNIL